MKKVIALFCSVALFCGIFLGVPTETNAAQAEETKNLMVTMEKTSGELVAGAEVTFKVEVTNPTNEAMTMNTFNNFSYGPINNGENGDGSEIGCITDENGNLIAEQPNFKLEPGIDLGANETKTFTLTGTLPQAWTEDWHITIVVGDIDYASENPPRWYGHCRYPKEPSGKPQLVSGMWYGETDIEIQFTEGSTEILLGEVYGLREGGSVAGPRISGVLQGNTFVIKNEDLKKAIDGMSGQPVNWSMLDELEVGFLYKLRGVDRYARVYIPVDYKETAELPYKDVKQNDWFAEGVEYAYTNKLMTGLNETTFGPTENLARAQFAVILHRMNGTPKVEYTNKFTDVPAGQWYTDAILWANSIGVVTGYSNSKMFGTGDNINREQMAVMMYRYAKYMGYDTSKTADLNSFKDAKNVNGFAKDAMSWAVAEGIITGVDKGTRLDPQGNAVRGQCAIIIQRFMEKVAK